MKGTCYFEVSCLQWKPLLQLFRFGSHLPVVAQGMLSSVCQTDALLRNGFASFDKINRQIPRYFHTLPFFQYKTLFFPFLNFLSSGKGDNNHRILLSFKVEKEQIGRNFTEQAKIRIFPNFMLLATSSNEACLW